MERYRHQRSTIQEHLNPAYGIRERQRRQGIEPKDHQRENRLKLRELALDNRNKQMEDNSNEAASWKMKKFRDVKSKITSEMVPRKPPANNDDSQAQQFLRRGSLESRLDHNTKKKQEKFIAEISPRKTGSVKPAVPREKAALAPRSQKNFISQNRECAKTMGSPRKPNDDDERRKHAEFGNVPAYIVQRKARWAENEDRRRAAMPDPNCPPGMTLMPESERQDTLRILEESEKETHALLFKLPLQSTTPSVVKRKDALEAKLREIESAKKMFSKPKVYIAAD